MTSTQDGQLQKFVRLLSLREKTPLLIWQAMPGKPLLARNGFSRAGTSQALERTEADLLSIPQTLLETTAEAVMGSSQNRHHGDS